jgi:hypothetical protein
MSPQRHIIKRQIFELTIDDREDAPRLQQILSRVHQQHLLPLIDQSCSALSRPDVVHRIDTLEIDLGVIDLEHFEEQYVAAFQAIFHERLASNVIKDDRDAAQSSPQALSNASLELFATYVRTGSLPWWADLKNVHVLDDTLQSLLTAPQLLRSLFQTLGRDTRALRRIVHSFDDAQLDRLIVGLTSYSGTPDVLKLVQSLHAGQHRLPIWIILLSMAVSSANTSAASFYKAILSRTAAVLNVSYAALVKTLHQVALESTLPINPELTDILAALTRAVSPGALADQSDSSAKGFRSDEAHSTVLSADRAIEEETALIAALALLEKGLALRIDAEQDEDDSVSISDDEQDSAASIPPSSESIGGYDTSSGDPLEADHAQNLEQLASTLISQANDVDSNDVHENLETAEVERLASMRMSQSEAHQLIAALRTLIVNRRQVDAQTLRHILTQLIALEADSSLRGLVVLFKSMIQRSLDQAEASQYESPIDASIDEFYVGNAGLVILWPFLTQFFASFDLLDERQFKDREAMLKAVGILQYLASGETDFAEYALPLNKVLCGMAWEDVYDLDFTLSDVEKEACDALLEALIAHASILNDMSIAGLRSTFLLRQGILSVRDGAWLLRVEDETYDIVLERFPWNWAWIKLPWMDDMMRVEW